MDYTDIYKEDAEKPQDEIVSPASAPTTPVVKQTESGSFKFCRECGAKINAKAEICPKCGVRTTPAAPSRNGFSFEKFIATYVEKFFNLSPILKIVTGSLTSLFIAPILLMIFIYISTLISAGLMYGDHDFGFPMLFGLIIILIAWIGAILIESIGFIMVVYGVRDTWREKKS